MNTIPTRSGGPSPWSRYRRRWRLIAAVTGAFLLLAVALSFVREPVYRAEARLAVGQGQMTALNIPGYPSASQEMASDYARWVTQLGTQGKGVPDGTIELSASPIVESNVIRIEATSTDRETAVQAAGQAADQLREAVNQVSVENDPARLIQEIQDNIGPIIEARQEAQRLSDEYEAAAEVTGETEATERLFQRYVDAQGELVVAELRQDGRRDRYRSLTASRSTEAELVDVQPARVVEDDRWQVVQRNGLLALVLGLGVSVALVHLLDAHGASRHRRQVRESAPAGHD